MPFNLSKLVVVTVMLMIPTLGEGRSLLAPVEGSRPGETFQSGSNKAASPQQPAAQPQPASPAQNNPNAAPQPAAAGTGSLVIMEFSDLQCPDSARFNRELKNTIMQRYVKTGKCTYEWRDFPLPKHGQAMEAAAAARCAGGSVDEVRQKIMANQGQMSANVYAGYARQAGVNPQTFSACIRSGETMQKVQADVSLGKSMGVSGTPILVLGTRDASGQVRPSKLVKGYDPPQQVLAEIDDFVATANAPRKQHTR